MGISVNGSIGKMRGLTTIIFLSAAAAVVRANPCQNDEDVYFPDPEDCGRFYMCVDGSVVGHMSCPDGLLWNNELLTCDWPRNVECKPGCPEGWSSVGDSCYFLSREVVKSPMRMRRKRARKRRKRRSLQSPIPLHRSPITCGSG